MKFRKPLIALVALALSLSVSAAAEGPLATAESGCIHCESCGQDGHDTSQGAPDPDFAPYPDGQHGCKAGGCLDHGICGGGLTDAGPASLGDRLDEVEAAVATHDVRRLRALIAGRDPIVLVPERNAIQVIGCGGDVAGHFKVSPELMASLGD